MKTTRRLPRFLALTAAAALFGLAASTAGAQSPHTHQHGFSGAAQWSQVFDDPQRDAWQKPHDVLIALAPRPGARMADIGAGTGYFAVRLARHVPGGHVYAVDTEPDMVTYLAERARKTGLQNMTAILGTPDNPRLPTEVDLVLMVDVYHHVADRERYFERLKASLAPGARVAIIDFNGKSPVGPPRQERIPAEMVKAEMSRAGYAVAAEHGFLPNQYFLVFAPRLR